MAADKVKVIIAFDRDLSRIGKTVEVSEAEARVLINEGRARLADGGKGKGSALTPTTPTRQPPLPDVVPPSDEVPAVAAAEGTSKK
jgi:hypothetical protein